MFEGTRVDRGVVDHVDVVLGDHRRAQARLLADLPDAGQALARGQPDPVLLDQRDGGDGRVEDRAGDVGDPVVRVLDRLIHQPIAADGLQACLLLRVHAVEVLIGTTRHRIAVRHREPPHAMIARGHSELSEGAGARRNASPELIV